MLGVVFGLIAAICWGTGPVVTRLSLQNLRVTSVATFNMLTGVVVLMILALVFHWGAIMALPAYIYLIFLAYGLLNNTMGVFFFTNGIRLVGPSRASIMSATQPLFAVTLAVIFLGEEFTAIKAVGTLAIVLGTMIIVTDKSS